jgi:uncharacterized membrane protein
LESHTTESHFIERVLDVIEYVAVGIEVLAVTVIVVGITSATVVYLRRRRLEGNSAAVYRAYRERLGQGLLLGLEILVAADVVRTVALAPTLTNVAVLGILVLIRTFLSWSLVTEIDGRWPWHRARDEALPEGSANNRDALG